MERAEDFSPSIDSEIVDDLPFPNDPLTPFMSEWYRRFGTADVTMRAVVEETFADRAFATSIVDFAPEYNDNPQPTILSRALRSHENHVRSLAGRHFRFVRIQGGWALRRTAPVFPLQKEDAVEAVTI